MSAVTSSLWWLCVNCGTREPLDPDLDPEEHQIFDCRRCLDCDSQSSCRAVLPSMVEVYDVKVAQGVGRQAAYKAGVESWFRGEKIEKKVKK